MKTTTIVLGGVDYEIDQLPIGVLREIDAEFTDKPTSSMSDREKETFYFDQALNIIYQGLITKHQAMTLEKLKAIQSNMTEFFAAREKILRHAGLVIDRSPKPGEASAEAS